VRIPGVVGVGSRRYKVKSPWLLRDVVTSKEDEVKSSNVDVVEDGNGPIREGEEALVIVNGLTQLQVGSSLDPSSKIMREDGGTLSLNHPTWDIFIKKKGIKKVQIGVEDRIEEERKVRRYE
jgi:hypothetical protein